MIHLLNLDDPLISLIVITRIEAIKNVKNELYSHYFVAF